MCLWVDKLEFKKATEDIVAYKVVWRDSIHKRVATFYTHIVIPKDGLMKATVHPHEVGDYEYNRELNVMYDKCDGMYRIYDGVIHCYKLKEDADDIVEWRNILSPVSQRLKACAIPVIIPVGTPYVEGLDSMATSCIAAKEVQYDKSELKRLYNFG